jgi:hypothetical protein
VQALCGKLCRLCLTEAIRTTGGTRAVVVLMLASATSFCQAADPSILELGGEKVLRWSGVRTPAVELTLTIDNPTPETMSNIVVDTTAFQGPGLSAEIVIDGNKPPIMIGQFPANSRRSIAADHVAF